jgi:hypothetical protein
MYNTNKMSEIEIINNSKFLICCFGGMALKMGGIIPFEFLNYLSKTYNNKYDLLFYIDKKQCCYHKGIDGITNNIEETVLYLNNKISKRNYEKIIFMGVSAGGYASILFGSLCNNINNVVSFIPKSNLTNPIDEKYGNLKNIINQTTKYILIGDIRIKNIYNSHHISQCENLKEKQNVHIIKFNGVDLKKLRNNGFIKNLIDRIFYNNNK